MVDSRFKVVLFLVFVSNLSIALAQDRCSQTVNTINTPSDALSLGSCSTITGDIVVASTFSGVLSLIGINEIKGSLRCDGVANITSIAAGDLNTIDQTLELHNLDSLTSMSFTGLRQVNNISCINLPVIENFKFPLNLNVSSILVSGTQVSIVAVFGLSNVANLTITLINNANMTYLNLFNVTEIQTLTVAGNNGNLQLDMDNLVTVDNMNIWNVSGLSMNRLESVNGSLQLAYNNFANLTLPSLIRVEDFLTIDGHSSLQNLNLPALETVNGAFQIADNPKLDNLNFGNLTYLSAMDFTGDFTSFEFPNLSNVTNYVNFQSTQQLNCDGISKLETGGSKDCSTEADPSPVIPINATVTYPDSTGTDPSSLSTAGSPISSTMPSSSAKAGDLSSPEKRGIGVGVGFVIGLTVLGVLIGFVFRARKANMQNMRQQPNSPTVEHIGMQVKYDVLSELSSGQQDGVWQLDPNEPTTKQFRRNVYPQHENVYELDGSDRISIG